MARLFGLRPEPVERCRVLEIGCGDGVNLMASSLVLPGAAFRGIDLSGAAIRRGRRMVRETGLKRVRLVQGDLAALDSGWGTFHYVVAHGLYSWVPVEVREALLAGIRQVLAPNGVAFVSYSVYPGAYLRQMAREMAVMFGGRVALGAIAAAREWLEVARGLDTGPAVYRAVLADEAVDMLRRDDGALFHDDLASTNQPCYFRDFIGRAEAHGLQYVSEADGFGAEPGPDRIGREQYTDFLVGRRFRQTLLCHAGMAVASAPDSGALQGCFVGGPVNAGVVEADGRVAYANRTGARVVTGNAAECRVLDAVGQAWPAYVPAGKFGDEVLGLFAAGMLDIRTVAPPVGKFGKRPVRPEASPLARWQAVRGTSVASLHHMEVLLGSSSLREVLSLADGTRTRAGLTRELLTLYPGETRERVAAAVKQHLEELWEYGLLSVGQRAQQRLHVHG